MASFPAQPSGRLEWRGIVEGFYGPPWTTAQRRDQLRFAARHGLTHYLLAAKDDPFHRARWRDPYPASESTALGELAAEATTLGIRFVVGIAPGLDWRRGDEDVLVAKARSLRAAGIRHFALLFDDLPGYDRDDRETGAEHGRIAAYFAEHAGRGEPLPLCPADYAGTSGSAYRDGLARTLPPDALILWSGPSVVSATVTAEDVAAARATYRREIVLWDNVPVNDFDRARAYVGPLRHRPARPALTGILANGMVEAAASRITLATVAEYANDPARYDPASALRRALDDAGDAEQLAALARTAGWPPDADTGAHLCPAIDAALAGRPADLRAALAPLAETSVDEPRGEVARELWPWLRAGRDLAIAAVAAADLFGGDADDRAAVRRLLERAEAHWPNVARDVLSPFVRRVLGPSPDDLGEPYAWLVAGDVETAGEERLAARLRAAGLGVRRRPDPGRPPVLAVVSRSADESGARAAADLGVPLLALFHLEALRLARASGVLLREQRVVITAPDHPLAGGRTGAPQVYRGPAMSRWGEPGPGGTVVARAEEEPRPVIVHYPTGAELADGTRAPAARAALFLGRDLLAPWVATDAAVALVDAAITTLLPSSPHPPPRL